MTARQAILAAARAARPAPVPLPDIGAARPADGELLPRFLAAARAAGADITETDRPGLARAVQEAAPLATRIMSDVRSVPGSVSQLSDPHTLADLDLFVAEAALGVAENGAVWLVPSRNTGRAAAFLAEHVVVAIDRSAIVADLHEAYQRIDVAAEVFGVFVAGPSKTADIEQSLVIGAHGPKRLTLMVL